MHRFHTVFWPQIIFRLVLSRGRLFDGGGEGWFRKRVKLFFSYLYPAKIYCVNTIKQPSLCLKYRKPCKLYCWITKYSLKRWKLFGKTKTVSEYDQDIPQSQTAENPWHREEEPHNNHETPGRHTKQSNQLSFPHQDDCKTRRYIK